MASSNPSGSDSSYYSIYINKVFQLAATIAIKSNDVADAINAGLQVMPGSEPVDETDPMSWKYYMNLAGEYHPTDTIMQVISMDTLETIDFTVANLAVHLATAKAYQYGTRQYNELLSNYPTQEAVIRGILYPVNITFAINARDHLILGGYPPTLVEVNEYSFLDQLQAWIDGFKLRWYNRSYTVSDNLYLTSNLGLMYGFLIPAIIDIRKSTCKTNEAHSFHVKQYLASHNGLDVYYDQMTLEQSLSLYRNILYLERNPGTNTTFQWLIAELLTKRQLPLAKFSMRHDVSQMPDNLYPTLFFQREPLNLGFSYDTQDQLTLDQMLTKEAPLARDNALFQPDVEPVIETEMVNSKANVLQTKMLESAMVDYTDATPYTLEATLLAHWLWLAFKGLYTAVVNVEDPKTGERLALSALDAYTFMWYAFCASIGINLDVIPPVMGLHVQRIPTPTPADLLSIVDQTMIEEKTAKWLLSYSPLIQRVISTEAFYGLCQQIWRAQNTQANIVAYQEHMVRRGYVDNMFNRIYADVECNLDVPGTTYTSWFAARNINIADWTQEDFGLLYVNIVAAATGTDLSTTNSVANLQKAMIAIMQKLSSYSVQYVSYINSGAIVPLDWPMVRQGDIDSKQFGEVMIPDVNVWLQGWKSKYKEIIQVFVDRANIQETLNARQFDDAALNVPNLIHFAKGKAPIYFLNIELPVGVSYTPPAAPNDRGIIPVLGIDKYLELTLEQQQNFKDVYGSCWTSAYPGVSDLATVIRITSLSGLVYTQPE